MRNPKVRPTLERLPVHFFAEQVEHPAQVVGRDEMQRASHQPGSRDCAVDGAGVVDVLGQ